MATAAVLHPVDAPKPSPDAMVSNFEMELYWVKVVTQISRACMMFLTKLAQTSVIRY